MPMVRDSIDDLLDGWAKVRPDLDAGPLGLVGRVIVLAQHLERSVESALAKHKLTLGQFDILATLRRDGPLTPSQLLKRVILTSGGMTNRLDKLESQGFLQRRDDPSDRRGVVVDLTAKGKKLIDTATETRFDEAKQSLPDLSDKEQVLLKSLLRKWLSDLQLKSSG